MDKSAYFDKSFYVHWLLLLGDFEVAIGQCRVVRSTPVQGVENVEMGKQKYRQTARSLPARSSTWCILRKKCVCKCLSLAHSNGPNMLDIFLFAVFKVTDSNFTDSLKMVLDTVRRHSDDCLDTFLQPYV